MGLTRAAITLKNPLRSDLSPMVVSALADTGALHLCIPQHVALQLGYDFAAAAQREVTTADGRKQIVLYVGPVEVLFRSRSCYVGALVLGDEVLLGAVPMKDMDLLVVPSRMAVEVNPASPNIPTALAK